MNRLEDVYLDHAAGTPPIPEAAALAAELLEIFPGNPSGVHRRSRYAAMLVDEARERLAAATGAEPTGVVFTSGGTEADNLAIKGIAYAQRSLGRTGVVVSSIEHHAVLDSARWLASQGFDVVCAPVTPAGTVDVAALEDLIDERTALVSIMTANNETGAVQPIDEIASVVRHRAPHAILHSDACQAFQSRDVSLDRLGVDALSLSSQKIGGPQGAGALVLREGLAIERILHGGGQELGRRAGTHNVPSIAGFGLAAEISANRRDRFNQHTKKLRDMLETRILSSIPRTWINAAGAERLPHISNVTVCGFLAEDVLVLLDSRGICASSGSACASGSLEPSHVLQAMGLSSGDARASLRFSFGLTSSPRDVETAVAALEAALGELGASKESVSDPTKDAKAEASSR
jgi:cysteine desulfurase